MQSQHTAEGSTPAASSPADGPGGACATGGRPAAAAARAAGSGGDGAFAACIDALQEARERTLALFDSLPFDALLGPRLPIVNPPLWELGHLGWFQERWLLRPRPGGTLAPSRMQGADALYDSSVVAHSTRWDLPLPTVEATRAYLSRVLAQVLDALGEARPGGAGSRLVFHATVCAQHEQMHAEAFSYSRQTLGYPAQSADGAGAGAVPAGRPADGDVLLGGGTFLLGAAPGEGFVFDNEKWAHPVTVEPFSIARTATTCAAFAAFVDAGGYRTRRWWSEAGWAWRQAAGASGPAYWRPMLGRQGWEVRRNDAWYALRADDPMLHVNAHEAEAWCRWAGRRLPSEAEWECAASVPAEGLPGPRRRHPWGDAAPDAQRANLWYAGTAGALSDVAAFEAGDSSHGCRQMTGNVWEWTASPFEAYPGFVPDPYREYSQPWFGSHRVLRGGCFATASTLIRNTWRNFFTPDRRDVYAGFRTCAVGDR